MDCKRTVFLLPILKALSRQLNFNLLNNHLLNYTYPYFCKLSNPQVLKLCSYRHMLVLLFHLLHLLNFLFCCNFFWGRVIIFQERINTKANMFSVLSFLAAKILLIPSSQKNRSCNAKNHGIIEWPGFKIIKF